jgi:hypothetical protein
MPKLQNEVQLIRYTYDFAEQGGLVGEITLVNEAGVTLDPKVKLIRAYVVADETLTSPLTPTVSFGINGAVTKYTADVWAALQAQDFAIGADIAESLTQGEIPVMDIGTAPLSGGKLSFYLEVLAST